MPNTREKLIELLDEAEEYSTDVCCLNSTCEDCPGRKYGNKCRGFLKADHLIANGVTIPVRCKDCKYWEQGKDYEPYCNHWGNMMADSQADDFCSYGERRNGEDGE